MCFITYFLHKETKSVMQPFQENGNWHVPQFLTSKEKEDFIDAKLYKFESDVFRLSVGCTCIIFHL